MSDNDTYMIAHLVTLLEVFSDDIRAVEIIAKVLLLPINYAAHLDNKDEQKSGVLRIMRELDITRLMYKI